MLAYYSSILRRRAWLVAILSIILAPAIFVALTAGPTTYTSQAIIQVGSGAVTDGVITDGRSYEEPERRIATELEVLTGGAVAEEAAERLRAQGWNAPVGDLLDSLVASPRGGASAIEVLGTDTDPVRAQQLTAAFVGAFVDYRREQKQAEAERVQADLRTRLAAARATQDSQARYDTLAEWLEGVTLRASVDTTGLELISPPSLPDEASQGVAPAAAVVASLVGALALACGIALALDLARDSVRNREEAELVIPTQALVEMPRVHGDGETWLASLADPAHPTSSAARGLRLRLGNGLASGRDVRVMVAGPDEDGRDTLTVAAALAATYGRSSSPVLLVADPLQGTAFETPAAPAHEGSVVAVGDAPEARPTGLAGVWQVPATTGADATPGVLDVHDPAEALDQYGQAFDVVVIAIPPRGDESEAVAVGQLVQAAVVVGALGRTPTKRLRRLVTALQSSGATVSGLALTSRARRGTRRATRPVPHEDRLPVRAA